MKMTLGEKINAPLEQVFKAISLRTLADFPTGHFYRI